MLEIKLDTRVPSIAVFDVCSSNPFTDVLYRVYNFDVREILDVLVTKLPRQTRGWDYLSPADSFPKAKAAARKALELDDTVGEAHAALAHAILFADWDWASAEREFKRAIELNPNSAISHGRRRMPEDTIKV